jgi:peptide/nickel transport system substrate-binding protein
MKRSELEETMQALVEKMISRRRFLTSTAGLGAALILAGCGQETAPPPTAAEAKPAATAAPVAQPTTPPTAASAKPQGTLRVAQGLDPRSLYGNSSTIQQEINVYEQITEKLIEFSADGSSFEPRLATEWEQLDDTTLQMKLQQNLKFTNGEEFDADSAVFSLQKMIEAPGYASWVSMLEGAEVVDKYTINVKTKYPTMLHVLALAMGSFQYPRKLLAEIGEEEFGKNPIGTGPFAFGDWLKDSQVTLQNNPDYWAGPASIQTVVFRNIPEGAARLAALEAGDVDFIIDVPLDSVDRVEGNPELQLFMRPSSRFFYMVPSTLSDTPLKDAKVRQALQYAVDVDALIKGLFNGRATRLQGQFALPWQFGFDPERQAKPYDPDKAKQMIAEAGYPDGFDITFKYSAGRYVQDKEVGQAIAAQLAKVGIRCKQEVLESGTFLTQLINLQLNDMYIVGSLSPPDINFSLQVFETGFMHSYYSNPKFDELFRKAAKLVDPAERMSLYKQINTILDEDPPYVPLYYPNDHYGARQNVGGFTPRASQFLDIRTFTLA